MAIATTARTAVRRIAGHGEASRRQAAPTSVLLDTRNACSIGPSRKRRVPTGRPSPIQKGAIDFMKSGATVSVLYPSRQLDALHSL